VSLRPPDEMPPQTQRRLSEIILAFRAGVLDEQAQVLVQELGRFPEAVRVEPSDMPEATHMIWFHQDLVIPLSEDQSLVFTPDPVPSVEYLRRANSGLWRLWYPGEPIE
jgi:hypothetical protein